MTDDSDVDPSWRANPLEPTKPSAPAPPLAAPVPAPAPEAASAPAEDAPVEEAPAAPPPPAGSSSGVTAALFVAMLLGGGLVWRFTAPGRAFNRGSSMLARAERAGDAKAAAEALRVLRGYVDETGRGYDRLFEAASLAGDDAAGEAYEARLMKSVPTNGSALLVWYESALVYHALDVRKAQEAFGASADPAERRALVARMRPHVEAAAALKPTRPRAVEEFDGGFPRADAARLLRIDAMQREFDALDLGKLADLAAKPPVPAKAPDASGSAAATPAVSTPTVVSTATAR